MSTTTEKLALFKYDPSTDGAQTFNIKQAMNDNWDKIDDAVKDIDTTLQKKAESDLSNVSNETMKAKIESSGFAGGILPQIIVTAPTGSTVTCTKETTVLTAQEVSGTWEFNVPEYGEWTVSDGTVYYAIVVDAVKQFRMKLVNPVLENNSWSDISAVAEAGNAASFWSVGATKTINLNGVSYTAQIIGFNHDDKSTGGKAGITFQLVDCLNSTYQINSSETTVGGWKNSAMRSRMSEFFGQLDEDLQSVIKPVNKLTSIGNKSSTIETVSDNLFLLSEVEIFGSTKYSFSGEGSQYDWYKAGNTKVKKVNGSNDAWWARSPRDITTIDFCCVNSGGNFGVDGPHNSHGVSFAFCV